MIACWALATELINDSANTAVQGLTCRIAAPVAVTLDAVRIQELADFSTMRIFALASIFKTGPNDRFFSRDNSMLANGNRRAAAAILMSGEGGKRTFDHGPRWGMR